MLWAIFLFIHLVGLVGYSVLLRRAAVTGKFHPWVLATLLQTGIMTPMLVAAPFLPMDFTRFNAQSILLAAITVALSIVLIFSVTKAMYYLEAGVFSVVYSVRIVLATLLALVLLSEVPTIPQVVGGLLILMATFVIRQKGERVVTKQGMIWGLVAVCSVSALNVTEKQLILDVGVYTGAPIITLTVGIIMWAIVLLNKFPIPKERVFSRPIIGLMVLRSISAWGFIFALAAGALVSAATFVSALSVVLVIVLGAIFLGERDYLRQKIVAAILAATGLIAIIIGSQ